MSYPLVCLGDVADFINGVAFKPEDWGTEGKPIIRIQNLNDPSKEYNYTKREVKDTNIAHKGDLLVSWSASLGVYEWSGKEACINQHIFKVVPNDEIVSLEEGKKIFAFSDEILQSSRAKPFLKLSREIFGQELLTKDRNFLFKQTASWHSVYDITTIGHEYGHILWCDEETESFMNKTGNFKNIEEFKATTGGLISYLLDEKDDEKHLKEAILIDLIKRSVGLISWMEVDEVQPYYCEGLIHLCALFESNILTWDEDKKELKIDLEDEKFEKLKVWYIKNYTALAKHYLEKLDATKFLNIYATKKDKYFMPNDENIKSFVEYYFKRYQEIGQELDTFDKKENYIK